MFCFDLVLFLTAASDRFLGMVGMGVYVVGFLFIGCFAALI